MPRSFTKKLLFGQLLFFDSELFWICVDLCSSVAGWQH